MQGVGKVGHAYVGLLVEAGAEVLVGDIWEPAVDRAVEDFGVKAVPHEEILFTDVDVVSPCAMGEVLNANTIARLNCRLVVGSANNQLAHDDDADRLLARDIVYVPDFVANAGGVINVADELHGYDAERVMRKVQGLGERTKNILESARTLSITPNEAAIRMAMARIAAAS